MAISKIRSRWNSGELEFYDTVTGDLVLALRSDPAAVVIGPGADEEYDGASSFQRLELDMRLAAGAGKDAPAHAYLGPLMVNVFGTNLTKTGNDVGALIAKYSVDGTNAAETKGPVISEIGEGTTSADGSYIATIGGDSGTTQARAALTVAMKNASFAGSGFEFFLDGQGLGAVGIYPKMNYRKADVRLGGKLNGVEAGDDVCIFRKAGVPDGTDGDTVADKGSICIDTTNGNWYMNAGTKAAPDWKLVTRAA